MSRRAPLIAAVLILLLLIIGFFFLVKPKMTEVGEAETQLEAARQEEQTLRLELARLRTLEREAPEVRRELAELRKEIPPVADLPGLINLLQTAADRSGVDFFAISPGDPEPVAGGAVAEIPTQIQVNGGFFAVDEFLFRLENLRRAAKALSLDVGAGPEGLPQLTIQLDVRFYTTDVNAGPGSATEGAPASTPGATPSPGASPSPAPGASPSPTGV